MQGKRIHQRKHERKTNRHEGKNKKVQKVKWEFKERKEPKKVVFDEIITENFQKILKDKKLPILEGQ